MGGVNHPTCTLVASNTAATSWNTGACRVSLTAAAAASLIEVRSARSQRAATLSKRCCNGLCIPKMSRSSADARSCELEKGREVAPGGKVALGGGPTHLYEAHVEA